jgi:hypothetical protein
MSNTLDTEVRSLRIPNYCVHMRKITERQLSAFQRFLSTLPHGKDPEFVLLKGHILIEEQIYTLINRRLRNPDALREANAALDSIQAIRLAQSFFPPGHQIQLWDAILKLNKMRNDIAHNLLPRQSLNDRISDWVRSFPSGFNEIPDADLRFEVSLWSLFDAVSELVDTPSAELLHIPPNTAGPWTASIRPRSYCSLPRALSASCPLEQV